MFPVAPPAMIELGNVERLRPPAPGPRRARTHEALLAARNQLLGMAGAEPGPDRRSGRAGSRTRRSTSSTSTRPRPARSACRLADISDPLATAWGGAYVNDFIDDGRIKRVFMQGERRSRSRTRRTSTLWHVPERQRRLGAVLGVRHRHWTLGPQQARPLQRASRDGHPGRRRPGYSSGDAMAAMEELARAAAAGHRLRMDRAVATRSRRSGARRDCSTRCRSLVVFLCLAALYESWSIPFSVMLVVPLGVLGAVLGATLRRARRTTSTSRSACSRRSASGEERDPDRRVRRGADRARARRAVEAALAGGAAPPAADHHDLARVRRSACCRSPLDRRGRGRRADADRHAASSAARHRHGAGDPLRPGVLRPDQSPVLGPG